MNFQQEKELAFIWSIESDELGSKLNVPSLSTEY